MNPAIAFSRSSAHPLKRARGTTRKLPEAIDFLYPEIPLATLERVTALAGAIRAGPDEVLIAGGWLDEAGYYERLAEHLGVPFEASPFDVAADVDWRAALRTGVICLADGRWLMAPRGTALQRLLLGVTPQNPDIAIASPRDFERGVLAAFAREIAEESAEALPRARPDLCARSGGGGAQKWFGLLICLLLPLEVLFAMYAWVAASLVVAAVMCVAVFVRILATLMALKRRLAPPALSNSDLPFYSVVIALYKETDVAARLIGSMAALDYPAARHEIIFVVEEDDAATRLALEAQGLPPQMRIIVAPAGAPRTKPRALNIGLLVARGDLLVIFDAEDRPEPDQLRKAAARFREGSRNLAVLQAQLRIENSTDSWLTRLFALDYAVQFELLLPGMARLGAPLPLGGTSNHFRTEILRRAGGWDAWNVTEDADLGLRLARLGYRAGTLDSLTFEEAPPTLRDWFPQRRRWLKGWMQTFITHTRRPAKLFADLGPVSASHALALLAANTFGPAIGLWITLYVLHETFAGDFLGRHGGSLRQIVWLWAGLAGCGVISILLPTCVAIVRGRLWSAAPYLLLRPLHWLCVSAAAFCAMYDLWVRPHHWSKTRHGLARRTDSP